MIKYGAGQKSYKDRYKLSLKKLYKGLQNFFQWFQVIFNQCNSDLSLSSVVIDSFRNSFVDSIKKNHTLI